MASKMTITEVKTIKYKTPGLKFRMTPKQADRYVKAQQLIVKAVSDVKE